MGRPKLKNESKRRIAKSITVRKDLLSFIENSEDGTSKTIENSIRSSRAVSKVLEDFYKRPTEKLTKKDLLEIIELVDDASSIFTSSFDESLTEEDSGESGSTSNYALSASSR